MVLLHDHITLLDELVGDLGDVLVADVDVHICEDLEGHIRVVEEELDVWILSLHLEVHKEQNHIQQDA